MSRTLMAMLAASAAAIAVPGAHADEVMKQAQELFQPIPVEAPAVDGLKVTADKIALGKMLYFEPRLSEAHNISCNSCHQIGLGGVDARANSIGHEWQRGGRNAPTVLNAVSTRRSSGTAGRRTSRSRRAARSPTRSRWASPRSTRSSS
jgi:cytochrome c peroxidase